MTRVPRREFLCGLGASLGAVALTDLRAAERRNESPLTPREGTHRPRAKAVIMLFMEGGPSQADTFDPKPQLNRLHLSESTRTEGLATGRRFYVGSPFKARRVGESGIAMSDRWKFLAAPDVADELCVYRGCQAASLNHPEALLHMNTGSRLGGDPAIGAWSTYGLGSENQNLPGYVVMTELAPSQAGPANWSHGFLPPNFQGTRLRPTGSPLLDLEPPAYKSREHQRRSLDQLAMLKRDMRDCTRNTRRYAVAWRVTNWPTGCRWRFLASSTWSGNRGTSCAHTESIGRRRPRVRPPVPADSASGRTGGSVRVDLFRWVGQPRLSEAGPFVPHSQRRPTARARDHDRPSRGGLTATEVAIAANRLRTRFPQNRVNRKMLAFSGP